MSARILGLCGHLPQQVETNADLGRANPDWEMEKIAAKTGIVARRIAGPTETAADLAYEACRKLLDRALVPRDEIDYLLVSTQTPDHLLPSDACLLQRRLKLSTNIAAVDIRPGCAGYVLGLQLASALVSSGTARNVLLVTAETYSKICDLHDRTVRPLFGDGATATLVGGGERGAAIGPFICGTDGNGAESLIVPGGGFRQRAVVAPGAEAGAGRNAECLFMDGQAVFAFTLNTIPRAIDALLRKSGIARDAVDWYVFHQANAFMLENLAKICRIGPGQMVLHLAEIGNTVSSSIPLAIEAYVEAGRILPGQCLALVGFGVGFSWAACTVTWA